MSAVPETTLDWVIVGGGPIGVQLAVRLIAEGRVSPERLRIIDPHPALLQRWNACTASTGMAFLRSPAVHHLGLAPFELLQLAGRRKRDRRGQGLFAPPYNRPSVAFFARHCRSVVEAHGLAELHVQDRVQHIDLEGHCATLQLASGSTVSADRVVLALGNSDHPHWPAEASALRDRGGAVHHVFGPDAPIDPDPLPADVAILGGGISAAQLAVRLARQPGPSGKRRVTVLARHEPREHQFDSDPGWIGPKHMRGFAETRSLVRRRALIRSARHRGSMPPDVRRALRVAMDQGDVVWRTCKLLGGTVHGDGAMVLDLEEGRVEDGRVEGGQVAVGALVLATGFSPQRPGGALVDALIADHGLPVAPCGYPVVDTHLKWHPKLYVSGPLAELELGPTARNLIGGRRAAARIVTVARSTASRPGHRMGLRGALAAASMALLALGGVGCRGQAAPEKEATPGVTDSGRLDTGGLDTGGARAPLPPQGNLLIEEVYYAGAVPTAGIDRYYSDQFIELVNVADAPVMIGGLILGDAPGLAGVINPGDTPGGATIADPDHVYLTSAWQIPGEPEDVLLQPGASLVIAQDAGSHNPYSPVDLSGAHYETYVEEYGEDLDDAIVPNLESLWYNGGYDWLVTVFGPTIVVLSMDADELVPAGGTRGPVQAPVSAVVDTMEALMDGDSAAFKRLHPTVDGGFVHVSGTYTGESVRRRRDAEGRLTDTDDSGADFEVVASPEPGVGTAP